MVEKRKAPWRARKVILIVMSVLLVISMAGLGFIGNFFYNFALNPGSDHAFSTGGSEDEAASAPNSAGMDAETVQWFEQKAVDNWMVSRDLLPLHAYQIYKPASHKYAIICHGYKNEGSQMYMPAYHFYNLGYNILIPDARGHGQSGGDYIGMGWPERLDILDWTKLITQTDSQAEIVLYGVSMGAATVMMASGVEDLPSHVKCVVEDCGYTSVWDEFAGQLDELYGLPPIPILNALDLVTRIRAGYGVVEASAVRQVAKSHTPTLFIHGDEDTFVPFWMLDVLYQAASCEKEMLVVPGAAHARSSSVNPDLYWSTIDAFLERYIP